MIALSLLFLFHQVPLFSCTNFVLLIRYNRIGEEFSNALSTVALAIGIDISFDKIGNRTDPSKIEVTG